MPFNADHIPDQFVDVEFHKQPEFVFGDTGVDLSKITGLQAYEDVEPPLSIDQIKAEIAKTEAADAGLEWLISRIFNQSNEGSCVGNATTQLQETMQAAQFGKEKVVPLSAISMYKQIGSGPNSGANVSDALEALCKTGCVPLDTESNRKRFGSVVMPHTGFYTKYPDGWKDVAKNFRLDKYRVVRTYEGILTAGVKGKPVVVGRSGHSIMYTRPTLRNGKICYIYCNSWQESWGFPLAGFKGGFGLDTEGLIRSSAGWAFVGESVTVPQWTIST